MRAKCEFQPSGMCYVCAECVARAQRLHMEFVFAHADSASRTALRKALQHKYAARVDHIGAPLRVPRCPGGHGPVDADGTDRARYWMACLSSPMDR